MSTENKVIDLSQRKTRKGKGLEMNRLNLRFQADQGRAALAMGLVSLLFLVTLANNSLLSAPDVQVGSSSLSSRDPASDRSFASVPTGTSDWEDQMVSRLSKLSIARDVQMGRRPSTLDRLTLEFLEGKYSVRLENGKIRELSFADSSQSGDRPKYVMDRTAFLDQNRDLLPVPFQGAVKAGMVQDSEQTIESYDLVDKSSTTVAKVEFRMDKSGRLLSMKID
jgi:hypothetical protein